MSMLALSLSIVKNKNLIFALIEQTMDEVLPKKVMENCNELRLDREGYLPRLMISRAKQFITKVVWLVFQVFKLGKDTAIEMQTNATAVPLRLVLRSSLMVADFAEVTKIVMDGMERAYLLGDRSGS